MPQSHRSSSISTTITGTLPAEDFPPRAFSKATVASTRSRRSLPLVRNSAMRASNLPARAALPSAIFWRRRARQHSARRISPSTSGSIPPNPRRRSLRGAIRHRGNRRSCIRNRCHLTSVDGGIPPTCSRSSCSCATAQSSCGAWHFGPRISASRTCLL